MTDLKHAPAAFYYHPDGYETNRPNLMGRHAAGESFLKAFCKNADQEKLYCYAANKSHYDHFVKKVTPVKKPNASLEWVEWRNWGKLAEPGCLFTPGPVLHELAWQRRHGNNRAFSICGVTHTTATSRVMDSFGEYLTSPVQPWDALICTSKCVQKTVLTVLQDYAQYLQERFNSRSPIVLPIQLPVIPLGVDFDFYDITDERRAQLRTEWRQKMKIEDDEVAVLFFGRLAFHAKAHPMPMYIALEEAARKSGKKFNLILAGWFPSKQMQEQFISSAKLLCPSLRMTIVDGRNPEVREKVWYAADIFTSLSDNIQETFGLTPIEAMAAQLPVVVSDWNGYRETVTDGVDGFAIRTYMPPSGLGEGLALSHAMGISNYDEYIGIQSQFTSVDVRDCADAFAKLALDESLRKQMGTAGKEKVQATFDWKVIIPQYQNLWAELAKLRQSKTGRVERKANASANPLRSDPNFLFASYPTHTLSPGTIVSKDENCSRDRMQLMRAIPMANIASGSLLDTNELFELLDKITTNGISVDQLCSKTPAARGRHLLLSILWLAKMGLIHLNQSSSTESTSAESDGTQKHLIKV
ncbi:MAG TPA: glycosyltransferase family 4 protein [Oculatellaceae cyanobacterium]